MKQEKSQLKIGIILNYVNMILGNLIPIFYTPIMLQLLGQNEYGLYKLSSSVTSYLSLISLGIGSAVTRYIIKTYTQEGKAAEERMLGLFMVIFQIIAIITFFVGIVLSLNLHVWYGKALTGFELRIMKILVFLMACNTALNFSLSPYISVVSAHQRFVFLQLMNIISTCILPIINLIVLFFGFASIGMAVASLVLGVLVRLLYVLYVHRAMGIKARYKNMPVDMIKGILVFSFWVFVANIVMQLYNTTDTVMIGTVPALAATGVAVYNIGGTFNSIISSVTTGLSSLLAPKSNIMVFSGASNSELTDWAIKIGRLQGFIFTLFASGFIAFGQPFIQFYVGKGYEDAYWVAILMIVPNMIPLVQSVCLSIIVAQNKHRFRSLVYLGIAVANVIGTWILMKRWGIIGAAFMTGLATVVGQGLVMNWYYNKKIKLEIGRFWKEVGRVYFIPAFLCVVTLILSEFVDFYKLYLMLAGIIIYTLIYFILTVRFVMNRFEKDLILQPFHKVIGKCGKR